MNDERGMTLVEVVVAATILLVGIASTFGVVGRGQRLGGDAQRQQQAVELGQREIETLRTVPYPQLGLSSTPTVVANGCDTGTTVPTDPRAWLAGSPPKLRIRTTYARCGGTTLPGVDAGGEPLVTTCTGACLVAPGPESVTLGSDGTVVDVYRFVTLRTQQACPSATTAASLSGCTSSTSSKRISVAVVPRAAGGSGVRIPIWTSTIDVPST